MKADRLSLAELWDLCIPFLWNDQYVRALDSFLRFHGVQTILDCAGGSGFPAIELKRLGRDVTYADGSPVMHDYFIKKLKRSNLTLPAYLCDWRSLSKNIPQRFDAVLCRGNSLIYVDSWEEQHRISPITPQAIPHALQEFYQRLNPGGLLYVDVPHTREYHRDRYPVVEYLGERHISGHKTKLEFEFSHDEPRRIRTATINTEIDGLNQRYTLSGYLLHHAELIQMMNQAGFQSIKPVSIPGEELYSVLIGFKP